MIRSALEADLQCYKLFETVLMFLSVLTFITGISINSVTTLNETQHGLLEMILISEVMFKSRIYAVLLLICLAPLIVLAVFAYLCCKKKEPKAKLPKKVLAAP
jgi:hypothetical protein